jgi:hypothetical protein
MLIEYHESMQKSMFFKTNYSPRFKFCISIEGPNPIMYFTCLVFVDGEEAFIPCPEEEEGA